MIFRLHVYEKANANLLRTSYSDFALNSTLTQLPEQLSWILQEAEVLTEILDLDKQEAYLKVTTDLKQDKVIDAVSRKLRISGLDSTLIS
jgi:hypothetical protein